MKTIIAPEDVALYEHHVKSLESSCDKETLAALKKISQLLKVLPEATEKNDVLRRILLTQMGLLQKSEKGSIISQKLAGEQLSRK